MKVTFNPPCGGYSVAYIPVAKARGLTRLPDNSVVTAKTATTNTHAVPAAKATVQWLRTTKTKPCPCCGKGGWCEVSSDGRLIHCMKEAKGGKPTTCRGGGWIHELGGDEKLDTRGLIGRSAEVERLAPDKLDLLNREFMRLNPLSPEHKGYLEQEGIPTEGVGSLDKTRAIEIARQLVARFGEETASRHPLLKRLTTRDGERQFWGIAGASNGILFPATNVQGQIVGIQIRDDQPVSPQQRYRWLSSEGKGSTPLTVFPARQAARQTFPPQTLIITEGYKKAAAANAHWGNPTISVAGVSAYPRDELIETIRVSGVKQVAIAFDQDKRNKEQVLTAEARIIKTLQVALPDVSLHLLEWGEGKGKGLDDAIKAGASFWLEAVQLYSGSDQPPTTEPISCEALKPNEQAQAVAETNRQAQWANLKRLQNEVSRSHGNLK